MKTDNCPVKAEVREGARKRLIGLLWNFDFFDLTSHGRDGNALIPD